MKSGFDMLAPYYDRLAAIVFGQTLKNAQTRFFPLLSSASNILVIGGGTGWILTALQKVISKDATIWYIEASAGMLQQAQSAVLQNHKIHFVLGTEKAIPASVKFDVVITHFYFDLFKTESLHRILADIRSTRASNMVWLVADFVPGRKMQHRMLLFVMYTFFRVLCGIEARTLPRWDEAMQRAGFYMQAEEYYYQGFIRSVAYRHGNTNGLESL